MKYIIKEKRMNDTVIIDARYTNLNSLQILRFSFLTTMIRVQSLRCRCNDVYETL